MSLANLIRKRETAKPANDNSAKAANDGQVRGEQLAGLAPLALAKSRSAEVTPLPDSGMEARRLRVLAMLEANPALKYAVVNDTDSDPGSVLVTLAIRGKATCEFEIACDKYDPFLLFELVQRHGSIVH